MARDVPLSVRVLHQDEAAGRNMPYLSPSLVSYSTEPSSLTASTNDTRTWPDYDAPFQGSVETVGQFGKSEILNSAKSLATQHVA